MPKSEIFRLNYYVGAVLAQGGNMWFDESKIVFSPTSVLDRALGAADVEIPFPKIKGLEFKGDLTKFFHVKTDDKVHRFHGSQAEKAWGVLTKTLEAKGLQTQTLVSVPSKKPTAKAACAFCSGKLEPDFIFCPRCGKHV